MAAIVTDIGPVLTWFLSIFDDLMLAIVSNTYLLWPIIFGFIIAGISFAVGLVKRIGLLRG